MTARFGTFTFDSDRRQLTRGGVEVRLTPKAFDLLGLLLEEAPRVMRKAELHERLWPETFVSDSTLASLVKELRRALDDRDPAAPIVRTAHGVGYAFGVSLDGELPQPPADGVWVEFEGRRIALTTGDNLIGRDPAAVIRLDAMGVSRRHARIVIGEHGALLEDLGSKNGTMVAEKPVSEPLALGDGDQILVGSVLMIFHASAYGMSTLTQTSLSAAFRTKKAPTT